MSGVPKYRIVFLLFLGLRQFQGGLKGSALFSKRQQFQFLASKSILQLGLLNPNVDIAAANEKEEEEEEGEEEKRENVGRTQFDTVFVTYSVMSSRSRANFKFLIANRLLSASRRNLWSRSSVAFRSASVKGGPPLRNASLFVSVLHSCPFNLETLLQAFLSYPLLICSTRRAILTFE